MKVATFTIPYKYGDTIQIKPLFDIHYGNPLCDVQALKAYLEDSNDKTYFFGGGDMMDSIVTTDRRYAKSSDATGGDAIIDEQVEGLFAILEPYRDKIIGLGRGNHEDTIVKKCGTDPVWRLCAKLDVEYLGYSGLIRLRFRENSGRGRTVVIRWHHGWSGGARTPGASITRYSHDLKYWDADVYLYGHDHQRKSDRIPRIGLSGNNIVSKPQLIGVCGTYLKTYSTNEVASYSEIKGYPPIEIGGICLQITPTNNWVKMRILV